MSDSLESLRRKIDGATELESVAHVGWTELAKPNI